MALPGILPRRFHSRCKNAGLVLVISFLSGCANGDFGRIKPSLVTDNMHSWVGTRAAGSVGVTPSRYDLTDDERELRDLAYPLIEPPFNRQRWDSVLGEYGVTQGFQMPASIERTAYGDELMAKPYRSAESRYERLIEDMRNDVVRIPPFSRTAVRVTDMDAKREQSLAYIPDLDADERGNAMSRVTENRLVIDWVHRSLIARIASYRYALERLVAAYPSPKAADADRTWNQLRMAVEGNAVAAVPPQRRAAFNLPSAK